MARNTNPRKSNAKSAHGRGSNQKGKVGDSSEAARKIGGKGDFGARESDPIELIRMPRRQRATRTKAAAFPMAVPMEFAPAASAEMNPASAPAAAVMWIRISSASAPMDQLLPPAD